MDSSCGYNCSFSSRERELAPYADVAGLGVIAGFLGTAWLCVILVLIHYLFIFDPHQDPFHERVAGRPADGDEARGWIANPIDDLFKSMIDQAGTSVSANGRPGAVKWMKRNPKWQTAFIKAILAMCDVQIVTGIGILVSGYADLKCGISAYHFLLVGRVAWFSNLTHVAGLTVLRQYLHRRPFEKWIRLFLMVALSLMLLTAMGPTLFFNWAVPNYRYEGSAGQPGSYAICFFNTKRAIEWHYAVSDAGVEASSSFQSVLMSMLLLVFNLASRTIKLQSSLSSAVTRARKHVSYKHKAYICRVYGITPIGTRSVIRRMSLARNMFFSQMASLLVVHIYTDLLVSTLSDVYWIIVSAIWGTIKLFLAKQSVLVEEDSWAFGQILPAFLLLTPLLTIAEIFAEPWEDTSDTFETVITTLSSQPDPGSAGPRFTSRAALSDLDAYNDIESDEGGVPLETRRFRQHVQNSLARDFYHAETSWMLPAVVLPCLQTLAVTVFFFFELSASGKSAARVLANYTTLILVPPLACFLYIYLSFFFDHFFPLFRPWHAWVSWAHMLVTFALCVGGEFLIKSSLNGPSFLRAGGLEVLVAL
ncbi:hypothetical protein MFIFM68171_04956 [Madurella fahalii]|uniref:Uncharacterized protein n=1 Tax=Madurella fahalii TaxID=1157608 RepID=A0ABQ0GAF1_9PEZI